MEQIAQRETSKYTASTSNKMPRDRRDTARILKKGKGKGVPVHAMKPYRRSRGTAPLIPLKVGECSRSVRIIPRKEPRTKQTHSENELTGTFSNNILTQVPLTVVNTSNATLPTASEINKLHCTSHECFQTSHFNGQFCW